MTELLKGKYLYLICFLYFVLILAYSHFSESIPVSDGLGWDGVFYGELATGFFTKLNSGEITDQQIRRILPSFIIYVSLFLSDRDHNIQNVIIFFKTFNAVSLSIALFYWINICKALNFCSRKMLLGTILEFVDFARKIPANLKLNKGVTKYILKKACAKFLPPKIINRPKKGFGVPVGEWFANGKIDFVPKL